MTSQSNVYLPSDFPLSFLAKHENGFSVEDDEKKKLYLKKREYVHQTQFSSRCVFFLFLHSSQSVFSREIREGFADFGFLYCKACKYASQL